jgi:hypothetical protein
MLPGILEVPGRHGIVLAIITCTSNTALDCFGSSGLDSWTFHDFTICFTICLCICPHLHGNRAPKEGHDMFHVRFGPSFRFRRYCGFLIIDLIHAVGTRVPLVEKAKSLAGRRARRAVRRMCQGPKMLALALVWLLFRLMQLLRNHTGQQGTGPPRKSLEP